MMLLPDITQYYGNETHEVDCHQYKHKPNGEPEILGECHLCGVLLDSECEIVVYKNETFCGEYHVIEFKKMERDGEI